LEGFIKKRLGTPGIQNDLGWYQQKKVKKTVLDDSTPLAYIHSMEFIETSIFTRQILELLKTS